MKPTSHIAAPTIPPGSSPLMRPCVCGHHRYKHVCFERECREAGCKCQWFGEVASGQGTVFDAAASSTPALQNSNTPSPQPKGNLP